MVHLRGLALRAMLAASITPAVSASKVTLGNHKAFDHDKVACVYPISGQYGLLQRILYYCLLIFCAFAQKRTWLIAGALASALTYSAAAALHTVILAAMHQGTQLDLEIYGSWVLIGPGLFAVIPTAFMSPRLRESQFRPILILWAFVLGLAYFVSIRSLWTKKYPIEDACYSTTDGTLLSSYYDRYREKYRNCSYSCFASQQIMRDTTELVILPARRLFGHWNFTLKISFILTGLYGGGMALFLFCYTPRQHTEQELREIATGDRSHSMRAAIERESHLLSSALGDIFPYPPAYSALIYSVLFVIVVVLNELWALDEGGLPSGEPVNHVGQWAPWVAVAFALAAAAFNRYYEPKWVARQEVFRLEREAVELGEAEESGEPEEVDIEAAKGGGQVRITSSGDNIQSSAMADNH